jgi:heavy-metal-associated domain-containing protein
MNAGGIRLVHTVPGRVRFKIDDLKGDQERAEQLEQQLSSIHGILEVQVNPLTGSLVALYDPSSLESVEFQLSVASALGIPISEMGPDLLVAWKATSLNGSSPALDWLPTLEQLGTLVPLALMLLGVRSLLVSDKLSVPTWYDYLWFAFGSFFMLNRAEAGDD